MNCVPFSVRGCKIGTRDLAKSHVGVPIDDRIGRKENSLSGMRIPGFDPEGQIFKYWPSAKQPFSYNCLTLSWRRPLSYRNESIDLVRKCMDWFLYDNGLRHERVNDFLKPFHFIRKKIKMIFFLVVKIFKFQTTWNDNFQFISLGIIINNSNSVAFIFFLDYNILILCQRM